VVQTNYIQEFGFAIGTNGDVNGDGAVDMVIGDLPGVSMYLLGGVDVDTTLDMFIPETSNVQSDYENYPTRIIINGDFDGDGINDIVTTNVYHSVADTGTWSMNGIMRVYYGGDTINRPNLVYIPTTDVFQFGR